MDFPHNIDLIKIDVENYELSVLEGAKKTLAAMSPVIQCEMFVDKNRIEFYEQVLKPLGYNCYMMVADGIVFCDTLRPNVDGRDFLLTKQKLQSPYVSYQDETISRQLMP